MAETVSIRIRSASPDDAGSIARVHVDSWRTTYAGIVPAEYLAGLSYRDREAIWNRALSTEQTVGGSFVAETEGSDVIGFATYGPEREGNKTYRGELYAIYLLEDYQRMGLGRRLVSAVVQGLVVNGFSSILLWVLEENNPACRFYESLGGERVSRKTITIGGVDLIEVSYGWRDISGVASETEGVE